MAAPTRAQITAAVTQPKHKVEIFDDAFSTWYVIDNDLIKSIDGTVESGSTNNGLAFGTGTSVNASISLFRGTINSTIVRSIDDGYWRRKKIRVSYAFDTSDYVQHFTGVITNITTNGDIITYSLGGIDVYLNDVKFYSNVDVRRPIATKTTVVTVEDPTNGAYIGGWINELFWRAGGRPYDQKGINYTDADAKFWYSCENGLLAPEFGWISGENLAQEIQVFAQASGGQIYQDTLGTLKYVEPLTLALGSITYTFTDAMFQTFTKTHAVEIETGTIKSVFTPRTTGPSQNVYEDNSAYPLAPGQIKAVSYDISNPVFAYEISPLEIKSVKLDGTAYTPTASGFTYTATRVTGSIINGATDPIVVTSIKIKGRPITALPEKQVEYGSSQPERTLDNNVYVQSLAGATKLVRLVYDFYSNIQPQIDLINCFFDPDRFVGEIVNVDSAYNLMYVTLSGGFVRDVASRYRIRNIRHYLAGARMDIGLTQITNIPKQSDFFIIGTTYANGDTRELSY